MRGCVHVWNRLSRTHTYTVSSKYVCRIVYSIYIPTYIHTFTPQGTCQLEHCMLLICMQKR